MLTFTPSGLRSLGRAARFFGLGAALAAGAGAQAQSLDAVRDPSTDEVLPGAVAHRIAGEAPVGRGGGDLTLLGRLAEGETRGIALSGTTLFRSNGGYLEALGVADPTNPTVLGRYLVPTAVVQGVTLQGTTAYVSSARGTPYATRGSLAIVDVSNPGNMQLIGQVPGRSFYDVAVSGTTVYGATATGGLRLFDVSNPAAPVASGVLTVSGGSVLSIALNGTTAYLAAGNAGLRVVDVSNPAAPAAVGNVALGGFATRVVYNAGRAYVSVNDVGLVVVDVSVPATPTILGTFAIASSQVRSVALAGTTAYVGRDDGMVVVNVTNPAAMTQVGQILFGNSGSGQYIALDGTRAFVGNRYDGVRVIDVANPATPTQLRLIDNGGFSFKVNVIGNVAYVSDLLGQVRIVSLADPTQPTILSRVRGIRNADGVDVAGTTAYVVDRSADGTSGLTRVNVSNPASPVVLGTHVTGGAAYGLDLDGTTLYVANGYGSGSGTGGSLLSADVSTTFSILDEAAPGNQAFDVRVSGGRAYVATFGSGLSIFDVSTPSNMTPLSLNAVGNFAQSLEVDGTTVYMADGTIGGAQALTVVDASNPAAPLLFDTADAISGGSAVDVALSGNRAYVAVDFVGIYPYDVTNPANVLNMPSVTTSDRATGVDAEAGLVVVADAGAGLWVFSDGGTTAAEPDASGAFRAEAGPNPFRGEARVRYFLPEPEAVTLEVFSVLGARVARVALGPQAAGWNAVAVDGRDWAEGVYLYRLTAGSQTATGRLTLAH